MSQVILPAGSRLHATFSELINQADRVFFSGIPGVGKSLLLQQLALMAQQAGRSVTLLQWDTVRLVFETPQYPVIDGITHPMVIRATDIWLRREIAHWHARQGRPPALLIGELPLVGDRLMGIVRPADDESEALLKDERAQFIVPVPSERLRKTIEANRERSVRQPRHWNEKHDAIPTVLRALWQDIYDIARHLGLIDTQAETSPYAPETYIAVFRHLLRFRHHKILMIDEDLHPTASVYDFGDNLPQLAPTAEEAAATLAQVAATSSLEEARRDAARWYEF